MRRSIALAGVVALVTAVLRRRRAAREERDLWTEATSTPDLR
ncbi:MAG: DLW-39 family protein [Actinomycetes bacterium]